MAEIKKVVTDWLEEDGWNYSTDDERVHTGLTVDDHVYRILFRIRQEQQVLAVYAYAPENASMENLQEASNFVTRANYALPLGNFELDFNDGELRFKLSVDLEHLVCTPLVIQNMVRTVVNTLHRYYPAFAELNTGIITVKQAIEKAEA